MGQHAVGGIMPTLISPIVRLAVEIGSLYLKRNPLVAKQVGVRFGLLLWNMVGPVDNLTPFYVVAGTLRFPVGYT